MKTLKTIGLIWIAALALAWPMESWSQGAEAVSIEAAGAVASTLSNSSGSPAPAPAAQPEFSERSLRFYCGRENLSGLERVEDCASELDRISRDIDKANRANDDVGARKLERMIRQISNQAKSAISSAFAAATESSSFDEIMSSAEDIASEFEAIDESSRATEIRNLAKNLKTAALATRRAELFYAQEKREADLRIQSAWDEYNRALQSGDRFAQDRALRKLQDIQTSFEDNLNQYGQMNQSSLLQSFADQSPGYEHAFDVYLKRYDDIRARMTADSSSFTSQLTRATDRIRKDQGEQPRQTLPHPGEPRQLQGLFPDIYNLPSPGTPADLYGNMNLSSSGDIFNGSGSNSLLGNQGRFTRGQF